MNVFSARGVTVRYAAMEKSALHDLALDIPAGRFTAIIGPNGSGKSTLLRVLLGALPPQAGSVHFEGQPLARYSRAELARRIGVVTQIEDMPFPVSVRELVATPLREDVPHEPLHVEDALRNAPDRKGSTFRVPRIIE